MNPKERNELIDALLEACITEADMLRLEAEMSIDPTARRAYLDRVALSQSLVEEARSRSVGKNVTTVPRGSFWLSWRPLAAAAAAGIVLGMFCTSVVWAFAARGASLSLLHESFEGAGFGWQGGFPKQMGQWGGDEASIVSSEAGVNPRDGVRMLKLEPVKTELFNRTHCLVDLQQHSQALGATTRQVELRASFRPAVLGKVDRYILRAAAFADGPEKLEERWMKEGWAEIDEHSLAYAARGVSVPAGTDAWQTITLMIDVPPGSRMLVISMWAATMDGKPANRAAHYLDDVRLSAVLAERLP